MKKLMLAILFIPIVFGAIQSVECNGDSIRCTRNRSISENEINMTAFTQLSFVVNANSGFLVNIKNIEHGQSYYPNMWVTQKEPSLKWSCDSWKWNFVYPIINGNDTKTYCINTTCSKTRVSNFIQYPYYNMLNNLRMFSTRQFINVTYSNITNKKFPIIRIDNGKFNENKTCVVMTYRLHGNEAYTQFYWYGFMKKVDKVLVNKTSFLIFPMSNPTGQYDLEYYGANKQNLNRCFPWVNCPENEIIKTESVRFFNECGKIDYMIDWHTGDLGLYENDVILYSTTKEYRLAKNISKYTTIDELGDFDNLWNTSTPYFRNTFNASSITIEIQQHDDWHTVDNMVKDGENFAKVWR